jgi:hypothetical protein
MIEISADVYVEKGQLGGGAVGKRGATSGVELVRRGAREGSASVPIPGLADSCQCKAAEMILS